jgi:hypothetical protein
VIQAYGPGYENLLAARQIVEDSLVAHVGARTPEDLELSFVYTGTLRRAGHFARPFQVNAYAIEGRVALAVDRGRAAHHGTLTPREGEDPVTAQTIVTPRGVSEQRYWRPRVAVLTGDDAIAAYTELRWLAPHEPLRDALAGAASLRWLGERTHQGRPHALVTFVDARGLLWNLYIDRQTRRLSRVERLVAHAVEGDAHEWFEYADYHAIDGLQLPRRRTEVRLEQASSWSRELTLDGFTREVSETALEHPEDLTFEEPPAPAAAPENAVVTSVADGVYAIALPHYDCRVLLVEFDDHSVVLEAPLASAAGEAILAAAAETLPDKPVRYLAMGHHHPHYTAGLRPFVRAGVTLVTTPGSRALLESIASRPHRIDPDAQARDPAAPKLLLVEDRREFSDARATLELIDIGEHTRHTEEYLVFYLPAHRLLFEGDLGWMPKGEPDAGAGRSARRLLKVIDALDRDVERVIQSWPLVEHRPSVTVDELRAWAKLAPEE